MLFIYLHLEVLDVRVNKFLRWNIVNIINFLTSISFILFLLIFITTFKWFFHLFYNH